MYKVDIKHAKHVDVSVANDSHSLFITVDGEYIRISDIDNLTFMSTYKMRYILHPELLKKDLVD